MKNSFLLVNPQALIDQYYDDIFRVMHQIKINGKPSYTFDSLIIQNVKAIYQGADRNIINLIKSFDETNISHEMAQLGKIHAKQKSGQSFEKYMERAAPRYLHGLFSKLAEVAHELKIYQRIKNK